MTTGTPMSDHLDERLSAYLDGELEAGERTRVEQHLSACVECSTLLEDLRGVMAHARTLDNVPPPADLWAGIASRLDDAVIERPAAVTLPQRSRVLRLPLRDWGQRFSLTIPQLAAASIAIAALSGSAVWFSMRQPLTASSPVSSGPVAVSTQPGPMSGGPDSIADTAPAPTTTGLASATPPAGATVTASTAGFNTASYDQAVAELQDVLTRHRAELDPNTVKLVETNLAAIDVAITQARKALVADPSNPYLSGHLAQQMKRKVRVLQQTAELLAVNYSDDTR